MAKLAAACADGAAPSGGLRLSHALQINITLAQTPLITASPFICVEHEHEVMHYNIAAQEATLTQRHLEWRHNTDPMEYAHSS